MRATSVLPDNGLAMQLARASGATYIVPSGCPDIVTLATEIWGKPTQVKPGEVRFGTNGSKSVRPAPANVWTDHESNEGGGYADLFRAHYGKPPESSARKPQSRIISTYDYEDESGTLLFQVARMEPKTFRQRRPDPASPKGWTWSVKGLRQVPYRLPDLIAAPADAVVYIPEGEKDVDNLRRLGLVATCNPGGAGKWHPDLSRHLAGRHVVILPDNDPAGQAHGRDLVGKLHGVAASVRVLNLPGLPEKGDVSDWVGLGGTAETLERLAREAKPGPRGKDAPAEMPKSKADLLEYFDDIAPVLSTRCLIAGVLGEGTAGILYGDSNSGKTFAALDMALCIATGMAWHGREVRPAPVLYAALEGGSGFRNRVAAWRSEKHSPENRALFAALPAGLDLVSGESDASEVKDAASAMKERLGQSVGLIVIDTLSRAMAGGNENGPEDMGALVRNMDDIRAATGATVLLIHHSGKDAARGARGHSLLRAAVDTEIELVANDDGDRTLRVTKQRDMEGGAAFAFRLEVVTVGVNPETAEPVTSCVPIQTVAAPATPAGRALNAEAETLRRSIVDMIADGEAKPTTPEPGMPEVQAITRKALQERLIRNGWLRDTLETPGSVYSVPHSVYSIPHSEGLKVPKSEHTRLWKRLNELKSKYIIGANRDFVWMIRS